MYVAVDVNEGGRTKLPMYVAVDFNEVGGDHCQCTLQLTSTRVGQGQRCS